jgi:hypothetical protein
VVEGVHPEIDRLCAEMMAMDPAQRPQEMLAVRERLFRIYPHLENTRMPMQSLTGDPALEATALASSTISGEIQKRIEQAVGESTVRGATQTAMALGPQGSTPPDARRRRATLIAAACVFGLIGVVGGVAIVKLTRGEPEASPSGYGLVESTVAAAAPNAAPAQSAAASAAPADAGASTGVSASASANGANANGANGANANGASANAAHAASAKPSAAAGAKPAKSAPSATPPAEVPTARPVGGTGVSTEF